MKAKFLLPALFAGLFVFSCKEDPQEPPFVPAFSVDQTEVQVAAAAAAPTIKVTSNVSWSILQTTPCNWITISPERADIDGKKETETTVTLTVLANPEIAARSYTFQVVPDDAKVDMIAVTVNQGAGTASLALATQPLTAPVAATGANVAISVSSNTAWTASVKTGATAAVTFQGAATGTGNGSVTAVVAANADHEAKTATVVFSAAGCTDVEFVINQEAAAVVPEFSCVFPTLAEGKYALVDDHVFSSLGCSSRYFAIQSNVAWTAKVGTETTASNVQISATSGSGNLEKFEVTVGPNTDLANRKKVVVEFTAEGITAPYKVEFQQEKGSILALEFRDQLDAVKVWPFTVDAATAAGDAGPGSFTVKNTSYVFNYGVTANCFMEDAHGWTLGKDAPCWIETPVIEGKRLAKVTLADGNVTSKPQIIPADGGTAVIGGSADNLVPATPAKRQPATWTLPNTEVGKKYRISTTANQTLRVLTLVLEYEDAAAVVGESLEVSLPAKVKFSDPAVFSSCGSKADAQNPNHGKRKVLVTSTKPWSVSVVAGETTATGVVRSKSSGEAGSDFVEVSVGPNTDLNNRKQVVLQFTADGVSPAKITIPQEKASILTLEFRDFDNKNAVWAFEDAAAGTLSGEVTGSNTVAGRTFKWLVGGGSSSNSKFEAGSSFGWLVGRGVGNYIEFPAIEGKKLKRVSIADNNAGADPQIVSADGENTVVAGGEKLDTDVYKGKKNTIVTWNITGAEVGKAYRFYATKDSSIRVMFLEVEYE